MKRKIKDLWEQAAFEAEYDDVQNLPETMERFAELIISECRLVLDQVYHETPLLLCGPLLTLDEKILERFYKEEDVV